MASSRKGNPKRTPPRKLHRARLIIFLLFFTVVTISFFRFRSSPTPPLSSVRGPTSKDANDVTFDGTKEDSEQKHLRTDRTSAESPIAHPSLTDLPEEGPIFSQQRLRSATGRERLDACRKLLQRPSRETGEPRTLFAVVFDIGSTGNRVHSFRLKRNDPLCSKGVACLEVEDELFLENHAPLASITDPNEAARSLEVLYDEAVNHVTKDQQACTTIQFMATAGLRKLGTEKADAILDEVHRYFQEEKNVFWLRSKEDCRILEGWEEGALAWITVNALLGRFKDANEPTAAIIDLGGGSTQIVFEPSSNSFRTANKSFLLDFNMGVRHVQAYQHSYNLGLFEGTNLLLARVAESGNASEEGDNKSTEATVVKNASFTMRNNFPCFAEGFVDAQHGVSRIGVDGGANFSACVDVIDRVLFYSLENFPCPENTTCGIGSTFQPPLEEFAGPFYAFSFFYDLMNPSLQYSTENPTVANPITAKTIEQVGTEVCQKLTLTYLKEEASVEEMKKLHPQLQPSYSCMYYSYIYALLVRGYGMNPDRQIHIAKKINGLETAWALGAGLLSISQENLQKSIPTSDL